MWQLYLVIGYLFDVLIELHPVIKVENSYLEIVYFNKFQRKKKKATWYFYLLPVPLTHLLQTRNKLWSPCICWSFSLPLFSFPFPSSAYLCGYTCTHTRRHTHLPLRAHLFSTFGLPSPFPVYVDFYSSCHPISGSKHMLHQYEGT